MSSSSTDEVVTCGMTERMSGSLGCTRSSPTLTVARMYALLASRSIHGTTFVSQSSPASDLFRMTATSKPENRRASSCASATSSDSGMRNMSSVPVCASMGAPGE
eukprot:4138168-Prymnesium_polylepis.1